MKKTKKTKTTTKKKTRKPSPATPKGARTSSSRKAAGRRAGGKGRATVPAVPKKKQRKEAGAGQPRKGKAVKGGTTAQDLALRQREISVSEFFTKNRHLLGFDNPRRALLAAVKEAVDNSLDACEESGRLPEISVELREVAEDRIRIIVEDNGPGIVRAQIPKIFGKLLYGSKFHALKQTRGQQGIGISAAGMYGQLTTGRPVAITSRSRPGGPAHYYEIQIDTQKNQPIILKESEAEWDHPARGTRVEIELEGRYQKGRHSVDAYLQQAALANPHVDIRYLPPKGEETRFARVVDQLPEEPKEIKPHPNGVELGVLQSLLKAAKGRRLAGFLSDAFCRVSPRAAQEIIANGDIRTDTKCHLPRLEEDARLFTAMGQT